MEGFGGMWAKLAEREPVSRVMVGGCERVRFCGQKMKGEKQRVKVVKG